MNYFSYVLVANEWVCAWKKCVYLFTSAKYVHKYVEILNLFASREFAFYCSFAIPSVHVFVVTIAIIVVGWYIILRGVRTNVWYDEIEYVPKWDEVIMGTTRQHAAPIAVISGQMKQTDVTLVYILV